MLVLSRYPEEQLIINGNVIVTILEVRPDGRVRVGIEAPREVRVDRMEVHAAIEREKQQGTRPDGAAGRRLVSRPRPEDLDDDADGRAEP